MSQTVYRDEMLEAFAGMVVSDVLTSDHRSLLAVDSDLAFGRFVAKKDSVEKSAVYPSAADDIIQGITCYDRTKTGSKYSKYDDCDVISTGEVWVEAESGLTTDSDVFVRFSGDPEVFTVTFNADFVASNVINGDINGESIQPVTFAADQATTLQLLANAIARLSNVGAAVVTDAREITVTGAVNGVDLSSEDTDFTVTLGASQATDAIANVSGPSVGADLGVVRADADDSGTGASAVQISNARVIRLYNNLALIKINLP